MDAAGPEHNTVFSVPASAPPGLRSGYHWLFPEEHAVPLDQLPPETSVVGRLRASVRITQTLGNALGVTAVGGIVYAESDTGLLYAVNAATGKQIWSHSFVNSAMGNPVVEGGKVFVGLGNSNFSFRELMHYKAGTPVTRGTGINSVVALDARTGRTLWTHYTSSEDMPTPAYYSGALVEADGAGNFFALDAASGKQLWKTHVGGFDSMSSPAIWVDPASHLPQVVASVSGPDHIFSLSVTTGKVLWSQSLAGSFDTALSDEVPAVDPSSGTVIVNGVVDPQVVGATTTVDLAMEALNGATGKVEWYRLLGRGPIPPAFKAGVPMIHAGIVYMNAPGTDTMHAIKESTGEVLWSFKAGYPGRAAPVYAHNQLLFADGPFMFVIDPTTGRLVNKVKLGGLFGIVNPVVVGGTTYLDNSYNWIEAVPLANLLPKA